MKSSRTITLCFLCFAAIAQAAAPVKVPLTRYARLWTNSPFTVKPVVAGTEKVEANPFDDLALGTVARVNDGYFLVMLNKKKQGEKVIVEPGQASEFQVLEVRQDPIDPKKTEVVIQKGGQKGTVTYDEKVLAAAPKPQPGQAQRLTPGVVGAQPVPTAPGQPGAATTANPPRMRVVPPSGAQPPSTAQPSSSGGHRGRER